MVEDEDFVSTLAPGVGEIKCVVEEVQAYGYRPRHVGAVDLPPLRMQERAKKGIVHGTKCVIPFDSSPHARLKSVLDWAT